MRYALLASGKPGTISDSLSVDDFAGTHCASGDNQIGSNSCARLTPSTEPVTSGWFASAVALSLPAAAQGSISPSSKLSSSTVIARRRVSGSCTSSGESERNSNPRLPAATAV